jgi:hypothetical protein
MRFGISYWAKTYRAGLELANPATQRRRYDYYDPIYTSRKTAKPGGATKPNATAGTARRRCP